MARRPSTAKVRARLLQHALTFPGAWEDHPWDSTVVKTANGKIFAFLGHDDDAYPEGVEPTIGVKLDESHDQALAVPGAAPSGYGLGKAGWVAVPIVGEPVPLAVVEDWIEESYRRVARKKDIAELDAR